MPPFSRRLCNVSTEHLFMWHTAVGTLAPEEARLVRAEPNVPASCARGRLRLTPGLESGSTPSVLQGGLSNFTSTKAPFPRRVRDWRDTPHPNLPCSVVSAPPASADCEQAAKDQLSVSLLPQL
ncbi:Hypp1090 [Branchiostoma lanceolatum]|uniref:Hypp1090 protein n=1 Tax=Branchiostoma lanceolatum TaxID=7740 RepID=A0A8K0EIY9_BRALA|nr:Hypp1090 [Branchiostoma lanceolatum]